VRLPLVAAAFFVVLVSALAYLLARGADHGSGARSAEIYRSSTPAEVTTDAALVASEDDMLQADESDHDRVAIASEPDPRDEESLPAPSGPETAQTTSPDAIALKVRVEDPSGKPVARAKLDVDGHEPGRPSQALRTDRAGEIVLSSKPSLRYDLFASDPIGRFGFAVRRAVDPSTGSVVLRLAEPRKITVTTRVSDGSAPGQCAVRLVRRSTRAAAIEALDSLAKKHSVSRAEIAIELPVFTVQAGGPEYQLVEAGPFQAETAPATIDLVLERAAPIRGLVLRGERPAAGARVSLHAVLAEPARTSTSNPRARSEPIASQTLTTLENGRFEGTVRTPGSYFVRAIAGFTRTTGDPSRSGETPAPALIGPLEFGPGLSSPDLVLVLRAGGKIAGRVELPAGTDLRGWTIAAASGDGFTRVSALKEEVSQVEVDATFRFEALIPATWSIGVHPGAAFLGGRRVHGGDILWLRTCDVSEGATTSLDLDLRELPAQFFRLFDLQEAAEQR
jgi:hypothetical protein